MYAIKSCLVLTLGALMLTETYGAVTFTAPPLVGSTYTSTHWLPENAAAGTTVTTVVPTGGTTPYTFAASVASTAVPTAMLTTTGGNIVIANNTYLDHEGTNPLVIVIQAVDSATTAATGTATLTVYIQDLPVFSPTEILMCVADGAVAGSAVGSVSADGTGPYTYARTASGNDANATDFTISSAGAITVSTGVTLSAAADRMYPLKVDAVDNSSETGVATVIIYVGCTLGGSGAVAMAAGIVMTLFGVVLSRLSG